MVRHVRHQYGLKSRYQRLRERGMLTLNEIATKLHVSPGTIKIWRRAALLRGHVYNDKHQYLYEPPGPEAPVPNKPKGIARWRRFRKATPNPAQEVQYEA